MRSNDTFEGLDGIKTNTGLSDAIDWFKKNDIPLYGIQTNPTQKTWTSSPKSYAELMIDDSALGCPLKQDRVIRPMPHPNLPIPMPTGRPYVDWKKVEEMLIEKGIL